MKILVTGSSGHLGEALVRTLRSTDHTVVGLDITASPFTNIVGSIADRSVVDQVMRGVDAVLHTATLHKPHVATHPAQAFVDTNVTGTLDAARSGRSRTRARLRVHQHHQRVRRRAGAVTRRTGGMDHRIRPRRYRRTSTALRRPPQKTCARCSIATSRLPCLILRTSRFFPEDDDHAQTRDAYDAGESQGERISLSARRHRRRGERAPACARTRAGDRLRPVHHQRNDTVRARRRRSVADRRPASRWPREYLDYEAEYRRRGWRMFPSLDRVYVNDHARTELNWRPRYDFEYILARSARGRRSAQPDGNCGGLQGLSPARLNRGGEGYLLLTQCLKPFRQKVDQRTHRRQQPPSRCEHRMDDLAARRPIG